MVSSVIQAMDQAVTIVTIAVQYHQLHEAIVEMVSLKIQNNVMTVIPMIVIYVAIRV